MQTSQEMASESFDVREFLTNTGIGRAVSQYGPKQVIYSQGQPADAVFGVR